MSLGKSSYTRKKTKIVLSVLILCAVGILVTTFLMYRRMSGVPENLISTLIEKPDLSMSRIHHVATRDGRKEWQLDAESASISRTDQQAVLKNVQMTFYLKDGTEVRVKADHGVLQYPSNDIHVQGNVIVEQGSFLLKTEHLNYSHEQRRFVSDMPVIIYGNTIDLSADAMTYDLETNKTIFTGNVKGMLRDHFSL